jgi:hypothetical protein
MSLFDEFKAESKPRHYRCAIEVVFESMSSEDAADLRDALADPFITHSAIARVLASKGFNVTPDGKQVAKHRKGDCVCAR